MDLNAVNWWETTVGRARLEYELQALAAANIPAEKDERAFKEGLARLIVHPTVDGTVEQLLVTFPDFYPYFRFYVDAPGLQLDRHQHPFGRTLCLLGRGAEWWRLTDTVAKVLTDQLPLVLKAGTTNDAAEVADIEEQQAEPFSDYYSYAASMVQIDGSWMLPQSARAGDLVLGLLGLSMELEGQPPRVQALVLEVHDERGAIIGEVSGSLKARHMRNAFRGRWSRADEPVRSDNPSEVFAEAVRLDSHPSSIRWSEPVAGALGSQTRFQLCGIVFPEEIAPRKSGVGWVFAVRSQQAVVRLAPAAGASRYIPRPAKTLPPKKHTWVDSVPYLARVGRSGPADILARAPELLPLRSKTIAVFGAGCIGAPSVLEFARAGIGTLRIVDDDVIDPATVLRWPFGISAAGQYKVGILQNAIADQYPHTSVDAAVVHRLGTPRRSSEVRSERALLTQLLDGADLLYDATADTGVQRFLSEVAYERNLPYVAVSGTQGGWGGTVLRIRPHVTEGCWLCFRLTTAIPDPAAKPSDGVQPAGCANPTFTAAGFDMVELAMHGVRLAVSTLCEGEQAAYAKAEWDVVVLSSRSPDGALIAPSVETFSLGRHPLCPICTERRAA
jgi:molybdopterin/thiamine biosynthesis adenylyltransferase